jgi:hypothetical protein
MLAWRFNIIDEVFLRLELLLVDLVVGVAHVLLLENISGIHNKTWTL